LNKDSEQALQLRVEEQHRTVLEEMRDGTLQLGLPPAALMADGTATAAQVATQEPAQEPTRNEAQSSTEETPGTTQAEGVPVVREPRKLLLELLNAKTWLSGKQAHLQVALKEENGSPIVGARVLVVIEGAAEPEVYEAVTGETGTTEIRFEM